jgi:hypothetical protein
MENIPTPKPERTNKVVYSRITPIDSTLQDKLDTAFQEVITRFKDKHLS